MTIFTAGYGTFVARQPLTPAKARQLYGAGLRAVVLQVDWQRSKLAQRTIASLVREQAAARAAGLAVWWWAWVTPTRPREAGRRPAGPRALQLRLSALVFEAGLPDGFLVDAEVGGGWRPDKLRELPRHALAAREAGMPRVGLTSHGQIGKAWRADVFDLGVPQLYDGKPLTSAAIAASLESWSAAPYIWPALGCADKASTPAQMRGDLAALEQAGVPGALWWTARQLRRDNGRLAAATPEVRP